MWCSIIIIMLYIYIYVVQYNYYYVIYIITFLLSIYTLLYIMQINLFGANLTVLDKYLSPEVLPAEFGGRLPSYSGREWAELMIESRGRWDQGLLGQRYRAEEEEGMREGSRSSSLQESSGSLQY